MYYLVLFWSVICTWCTSILFSSSWIQYRASSGLIKIHCSGAGSKMLPQTVQSRIGIFCTEPRKYCFEMLIYSSGQPITRKSVSGPPSCPANIPADHTRSQFVTRDGFALWMGNMQCRWEISQTTKWRKSYFVPQAEDGARKMQAMDKKLRKTARTAKLGTRKQT